MRKAAGIPRPRWVGEAFFTEKRASGNLKDHRGWEECRRENDPGERDRVLSLQSVDFDRTFIGSCF